MIILPHFNVAIIFKSPHSILEKHAESNGTPAIPAPGKRDRKIRKEHSHRSQSEGGQAAESHCRRSGGTSSEQRKPGNCLANLLTLDGHLHFSQMTFLIEIPMSLI